MIDHVILTVADFMRSIRFYERALRPLGITDFLDFPGENGHPHLKGVWCQRAVLLLAQGRRTPTRRSSRRIRRPEPGQSERIL
jgi:catechol 2,3-dioxygenase-like lactoylglutathione lyase family enzyme